LEGGDENVVPGAGGSVPLPVANIEVSREYGGLAWVKVFDCVEGVQSIVSLLLYVGNGFSEIPKVDKSNGSFRRVGDDSGSVRSDVEGRRGCCRGCVRWKVYCVRDGVGEDCGEKSSEES
jgi:hypothetical protein